MTRPAWHRAIRLSPLRTSWPAAFALATICGLGPAIWPGGTAPAFATDDGGGESVFVRGAGNRALALGGAYVAIADDASAPFWNPAGVGRVARRELQVAHTNLIGLGFTEQSAALVLPSWRWGVLACTFRRFGVDGIDARDDRNLSLGGDVTDSETEAALGYGRELSGAWSLGGLLKLRRHSLAGMDDTGLGADLGVQVRPLVAGGVNADWAQSLSVGLAVRNAVEPSIRLDQETVRDPIGVRTGLALAKPIGRGGHLLAALDVEKSRATGARLHAGLEFQPLPPLALRGGTNNGMLTAGAGVCWQGVTVDYAFEDNVVSPVHRIGLSLAFGSTVTESRQAALAAQEDALQSRLAEAFEARQSAQSDSLAVQAASELAQGQHEAALVTLSRLRILDPEHARLSPLEAAAQRARGEEQAAAGDLSSALLAFSRAVETCPSDSLAAAALADAQAESDRRARRTSELRAKFAAALDAFAADSLAQARDGFMLLLAIAPEDDEAAAMLRRTEAAIDARTVDLLAQASLLARAGRTREAEAVLQRVRALDPHADGLERAAVAVRAAAAGAAVPTRSEQVASASPSAASPSAPPGAPARPALSEDRRRELAELYRRGLEAMRAGRTSEAVNYWEIVWDADPSHQRVGEYLKREYLTRGMQAFAAGTLDDAIRQWERALQIDPSDRRAAGYLERARAQQSRIQQVLGDARR